MNDMVRVGIVGTSGYTAWQHLPNLQSHDQVQLAAICGRHQERAAQVAGQFGIPKVYTDYNQMIEAGGLDALVIATPDHLHYPITMAALAAGLHVLCEKPLARKAWQAREMLDFAELKGLVHMTNFNNRWVPEYRQMRELIAQGYLGQVRDIHLRWWMTQRGSEYTWRNDAGYSHGVLGDLGSHMIDLARVLNGEITRVAAHLTTHVQRSREDGLAFEPANDSAFLLLEYANGAAGTIELSKAVQLSKAKSAEIDIELYGSKATIRSNLCLDQATLLGVRQDESSFQPLPVEQRFSGPCDPGIRFADRFFPLYKTEQIGSRQFIDAILGKTRVWPTFYDGWRTSQVIDAALESHNIGRWVTVDGVKQLEGAFDFPAD
jgi:predicted dehydrogenase